MEKSDYNIYYSCHPNYYVLPLGYLISKKMKPVIIGFNAINVRLFTLRVRDKFYDISLINVHAPTEDYAAEDKDIFFEEVERALDACPRYDMKFVLDDFNSEIGKKPIC